jgi:hypothetical protein
LKKTTKLILEKKLISNDEIEKEKELKKGC